MQGFCEEIATKLNNEGCDTRIIRVHAGKNEILVDGYVRGSVIVTGLLKGDVIDLNFKFPENDIDFVRGIINLEE